MDESVSHQSNDEPMLTTFYFLVGPTKKHGTEHLVCKLHVFWLSIEPKAKLSSPGVDKAVGDVPRQGRDPRGPGTMKSGAPAKVLPIEIPAIPLAELNRLTSNFGQKALVGEGSYGQVYRATLSTGEPVAIKKLDPSASNDPDSDFAAQVRPGIR
ncbi:hypothetical protein BHM03_00012750 [Ensete ventricosum]|uniref:Uncharacterized protein n=1 Tax=Ensete ventricosum TaxID=4639 RepID=A0A445MDJ7_ENSVE|nr:hypothetical protein BHM03_00012750 [Ensete ventricosum]